MPKERSGWYNVSGKGKHKSARFVKSGDDFIGKAYGHEGQDVAKNTELFTAAEDMALILQGLRYNAIQIYLPTGEIRFGGILFSTEWTPAALQSVLTSIGRSKLEAAIEHKKKVGPNG